MNWKKSLGFRVLFSAFRHGMVKGWRWFLCIGLWKVLCIGHVRAIVGQASVNILVCPYGTHTMQSSNVYSPSKALQRFIDIPRKVHVKDNKGQWGDRCGGWGPSAPRPKAGPSHRAEKYVGPPKRWLHECSETLAWIKDRVLSENDKVGKGPPYGSDSKPPKIMQPIYWKN